MTGPDQDAALWRVIRLAQAEVNGKPPPGNGSADPSDQEETGPNQQGDDHGGGSPPHGIAYPRADGIARLPELATALGWDDAEHVQVSRISTMPEHVAKERGKSVWFTRMITDVKSVERLLTATTTQVGEALNWYYGPCPVASNFLDSRPWTGACGPNVTGGPAITCPLRPAGTRRSFRRGGRRAPRATTGRLRTSFCARWSDWTRCYAWETASTVAGHQ